MAEVELTEEQKQAQAALEEKESEAALIAGYENVIKTNEPELFGEERKTASGPNKEQPAATAQEKDGESADKNKAEEAGEGAETDAKRAQEDEQAHKEAEERERKTQEKVMAGVPKRMRDIEGKIGGLYSKMDALVSKLDNTQAAPAKAKQEEEAEVDKEALEALRNEFKELNPLMKQVDVLAKTMDELRAQMTGAPQGVTREEVGQAIEHSTEQSVELSQLSSQHSNWREIIDSDDFVLFALEGGPTYRQYVAFQDMDPTTQDTVLARWQEDYADWWQTRGNNVFSPRATDAIRLIDQFKARGEEAEKANREKEERGKRDKDAKLRAAVAPTGAGGGGPTEPSVEDAIAFGYESVAKNNRPSY